LVAVGFLTRATTCPDEREALFEQLFELGTRATLKQHVPVGARGFLVSGFGGDRLTVDTQHGGSAAGTALPCLRRLCVRREHERGDMLTRVALVCGLAALHENDALFAL